MITREELRVWLASAPQTVRRIVTCQIAHSKLTRTRYCCNNGFPVTAWAAGEMREHEPTNFLIELAKSDNTLDQDYTMSFDMTDRQDEFRNELKRIPFGDKEMVKVTLREFLSNDLASPLTEVELDLEKIAYTRGAASFSIAPPRMNKTATGRTYSPRDISSIRGFL